MRKHLILNIVLIFIAISLTAQTKTTDMGVVINGVKWATRNADTPDTFAATPEAAGMFYQWNSKIGWSAADPMINSNGDTMWESSEVEGIIWEKDNDPCPLGWRIPTVIEMESLESVVSKWTSLNGVNGRMFGTDEPFLFLPAIGERTYKNGALNQEYNIGYYWSSTAFSINNAFNLYISNNYVAAHVVNLCQDGFLVRCVAEQD